MSFVLFKHLTDALALNESALSLIGITIYTPDGKIKNITTIFEEIAELWNEGLEEKIKMLVVDKEEILDFPHAESYGANDFIYDCICKCGLEDRVDEAFELAQMIIKAYQNVIKTATEYEVDVSERF